MKNGRQLTEVNPIQPETSPGSGMSSPEAPPAAEMTSGSKRPRLLWNILANYAGRGVATFAAIALVPLYLKILGVEAFGVVSLLAIIRSFAGIFDFGLGITLNRKLATCDDLERGKTLKAFEATYWCLAAGLVVILLTSTPYLTRFVKASTLQAGEVMWALIAIGIIATLELPSAAYSAALCGLEQQIVLNVITGGAVLARVLITVPVLLFVSRTADSFLLCQLVVAVAQVIAMRTVTWRLSVPRGCPAPALQWGQVLSSWRFSAQAFAVSLTAVFFSQADKIFVAGMSGMKDFATYSVVSQFAVAFTVICSPIGAAAFPQLARLSHQGTANELARAYERVLILAAVLTCPLALIACTFPREIILLWTHNAAIAGYSVWVLPLLAASAAINGVFSITGALTIAAGHIRIPLVLNSVAAASVAISLPFAVGHMGLIGAALVSLVVNIGYACVLTALLHRRCLRHNWVSYYRKITMFVLVAAVPIGAARELHGLWTTTNSNVLLLIAIAYLIGMASILFLLGGIRTNWLLLQGAIRG